VRRIAIFPEVDTELAGKPPVVFSKNGYRIQLIDCLSPKGAIGFPDHARLELSAIIVRTIDGALYGPGTDRRAVAGHQAQAVAACRQF
jgi:hypothetical protein